MTDEKEIKNLIEECIAAARDFREGNIVPGAAYAIIEARTKLYEAIEKLAALRPPLPVDVARLVELEAKATPGEWTKAWFGAWHTAIMSGENKQVADLFRNHEADAELIVALRNAAPALLSELADLRRRVEELDRSWKLEHTERVRLEEQLKMARGAQAAFDILADLEDGGDG